MSPRPTEVEDRQPESRGRFNLLLDGYVLQDSAIHELAVGEEVEFVPLIPDFLLIPNHLRENSATTVPSMTNLAKATYHLCGRVLAVLEPEEPEDVGVAAIDFGIAVCVPLEGGATSPAQDSLKAGDLVTGKGTLCFPYPDVYSILLDSPRMPHAAYAWRVEALERLAGPRSRFIVPSGAPPEELGHVQKAAPPANGEQVAFIAYCSLLSRKPQVSHGSIRGPR